jgi:two-component system, OmpR family, phosphate regulon sensor histidine kinase PhoR
VFPSRIGSAVLGSALLVAGGAMLALVVGFGIDREWGWITLAAVLAVALAYHLREVLRLGRWLERGGEPPRVIGLWDEVQGLVARSTREGRRREVELAAAVDRWRLAARALPDGVTLLDGDRIEWCNDQARGHLGIDPGQDLGRPITHLVRAPEFARYLEEGDYSHPVEMRPADGRVLSLQAVDYGPELRLVLSRDVTRFDRLERVRQEFVANVSHELRTPLTVVSGFLETLREDTPAAHPNRHALDLMDSQSRRMQRLVEDLLTLSSLESAPPPPLEETIDMGAMMERLVNEARALSGGKHAVEVEGRPAVTLLGSEKELSSALGNLVSNAVRYTPAGGVVRLAWRAIEGGGEFEVQDSGIGIAPEHIPRLTERFYRVDRGRSRETGGTGLGLAIVKHALSRHGATLHIESELGRGSRFMARFTGSRVRSPSPSIS